MSKQCRVRALEEFKDGMLADQLEMPWKAGEERVIPEPLYNRVVQSAGPTAFELLGYVVPPSTRKKASKQKAQPVPDPAPGLLDEEEAVAVDDPLMEEESGESEEKE